MLQSAALDLQQGKTSQPAAQRRRQLVSTLRVLQELHCLTTNTLNKLTLSGPDGEQQDSSSTLDATATSVCRVCGHQHCCSAPSAQQLQDAAVQLNKGLSEWRSSAPEHIKDLISSEQSSAQHFAGARQQQLEAETAANMEAAAAAQLPAQACNALQEVVSQLRAIESCVLFQAQLLQQAAAVSAGTGYSSSNFAYSSTPFSSWLKVHREPQVAAAIQAAMDRRLTSSSSRPCYMVWGASIGWLALYAALTHSSWSVVGIELLPVLVQVAQHMAQAAGLTGVSFDCGDLLASDLSNVGVLLLTEQCWDDQLIAKAAAKVQAELPAGSVVIDYTGSMGRAGLASSFSTAVSEEQGTIGLAKSRGHEE
ncbi:hypothetical protein OEZ85_013251 [Tetradesmus obliquus]|uniref:Methyltransferase domain-containing protein n=1 Tax=Tetradesmus obliquus TaxID=3088 RepID=A0ABY8U7G2_TETOB|nr:hypothetical protein OEZ85_013251 [Tetradesmus obliquus]